MNKNIISLFSGAGGLDKGFEKAGFKTVWANEHDPIVWETFKFNFPNTKLDKRDIRTILSTDMPDCIGIIGGPPCQSWSCAGLSKGIEDERGQLFYDFIRILRDKKPLFFVAENVYGMLDKKHTQALNGIKKLFKDSDYNLSFSMLNANDYNVPQIRRRVFFVGYRKDLNMVFEFPSPNEYKPVLRDCIWDLKDVDALANENNQANGDLCRIPNHEYFLGDYSKMFMASNRVRAWNEPSFTIHAYAKNIALHPQAPKMVYINQYKREFVKNKEYLYRRLSIRECARIQTFSDDFIFKYSNLKDGYKMVGNAVPVNLAYAIAEKIMKDLKNYLLYN